MPLSILRLTLPRLRENENKSPLILFILFLEKYLTFIYFGEKESENTSGGGGAKREEDTEFEAVSKL